MRAMVITLVAAACAEATPSPAPAPQVRPDFHAGVVVDGTHTSLTPDAVLAKIRDDYSAGINRCLPDAARVDISIRVGETGRTTGTPRGLGAAPDLCLAVEIDTWRFPVPTSDDGEPVEAAFVVTLRTD